MCARLRDDVVGDGFVGSPEGPAVPEEKALAQGIEALVVNAKDVDQAFGVREDQGGGDFIDAGGFFSI